MGKTPKLLDRSRRQNLQDLRKAEKDVKRLAPPLLLYLMWSRSGPLAAHRSPTLPLYRG